uniref:Uncharacterized protein n=1 Tax=Arundo donax TaxID=35708 RepID=A0A0A9HAB7_ARUDO
MPVRFTRKSESDIMDLYNFRESDCFHLAMKQQFTVPVEPLDCSIQNAFLSD